MGIDYNKVSKIIVQKGYGSVATPSIVNKVDEKLITGVAKKLNISKSEVLKVNSGLYGAEIQDEESQKVYKVLNELQEGILQEDGIKEGYSQLYKTAYEKSIKDIKDSTKNYQGYRWLIAKRLKKVNIDKSLYENIRGDKEIVNELGDNLQGLIKYQSEQEYKKRYYGNSTLKTTKKGVKEFIDDLLSYEMIYLHEDAPKLNYVPREEGSRLEYKGVYKESNLPLHLQGVHGDEDYDIDTRYKYGKRALVEVISNYTSDKIKEELHKEKGLSYEDMYDLDKAMTDKDINVGTAVTYYQGVLDKKGLRKYVKISVVEKDYGLFKVEINLKGYKYKELEGAVIFNEGVIHLKGTEEGYKITRDYSNKVTGGYSYSEESKPVNDIGLSIEYKKYFKC